MLDTRDGGFELGFIGPGAGVATVTEMLESLEEH